MDIEALTQSQNLSNQPEIEIPSKDQSKSAFNQQHINFITQMQSQNKKLSSKSMLQLINDALLIFQQETTVIDLTIPKDTKLTIVGDLHGRYSDLMNILETNGIPDNQNHYIFNGDFIDKGDQQIQVITTILAYKVAYPKYVYLTRGNHETDGVATGQNSFKEIAEKKFGHHVYAKFQELFRYLPLVYIVNKVVQVNHGGLFSDDDVKIEELRRIDRVRDEPGRGSLMEELLWSDPVEENGLSYSRRGVGVEFGPDVTRKYLENNGLKMLVRSHQAVEQGFLFQHNGQLITVHSACNPESGYFGAFLVMRFDGEKVIFITAMYYDEDRNNKVRTFNYQNRK